MKLKIHMKSGKTIIVNRIKDWKVNHRGNEIVQLTIIRRPTFKRRFYGLFGKTFHDGGLIMGSLNLEQIEAIEKV